MIAGLAAVCKSSLEQDPFAGTVFVFRNRRATATSADDTKKKDRSGDRAGDGTRDGVRLRIVGQL